MRSDPPIRLLLLLLLFAGCRGASSSQPVSYPFKPEREPAGLHNFLHLSPTIYSGGEPHGEEAFASLQKLGVKTIVSVDGAKPDVETAKRYGLRYIHIPFGYDSIPEEARLKLVAVARSEPFPIYVHCHHGKHRGPAGAAILCVANGQTDPPGGKKILELAETSHDYAGLWRDVEKFLPPAPEVKLPTLVEIAPVDSLATAMASIDRHWDNLKLCEKANWQPPKDHPDLSPVQEALLVKENLHESHRNLKEGQPNQLKDWLGDAEKLAEKMEMELRAGRTQEMKGLMQQLDQSCKGCHKRYRN